MWAFQEGGEVMAGACCELAAAGCPCGCPIGNGAEPGRALTLDDVVAANEAISRATNIDPIMSVRARAETPQAFADALMAGSPGLLLGAPCYSDSNVPLVDSEGAVVVCWIVMVGGRTSVLVHPRRWDLFLDGVDVIAGGQG